MKNNISFFFFFLQFPLIYINTVAAFAIIAFIMVVSGLGYIIKSPERRAKCRSLFSRRTVAVQYTRVSVSLNQIILYERGVCVCMRFFCFYSSMSIFYIFIAHHHHHHHQRASKRKKKFVILFSYNFRSLNFCVLKQKKIVDFGVILCCDLILFIFFSLFIQMLL